MELLSLAERVKSEIFRVNFSEFAWERNQVSVVSNSAKGVICCLSCVTLLTFNFYVKFLFLVNSLI